MGKYIVINKLNLGRSTVGYRIDIVDHYRKVATIDISDKRVKAFLQMIGNVKMEKGVIIQGKLVNGLFVTGHDDNILEVQTKEQVQDVLNTYFFNKENEVDSVLNSIDKTADEIVDSKITGKVDTLRGTEFGDTRVIVNSYKLAIASLRGTKHNFIINECQDSYSGEFKFSAYFSNPLDALKYMYRFEKSLGKGSDSCLTLWRNDISKYCTDNISLTCSFKDYVDKVKSIIGDTSTLEGNTSSLFITYDDDLYIVDYSISIPGYVEVEYGNIDSLIKKYKLG